MSTQVTPPSSNSPFPLRPLCELCDKPFSFFRLSGLLLATRHSTGTAFLLPSLCGNSALSVLNLYSFFFLNLKLKTDYCELSKPNHSRTYEPFSRKSNYSRTYAKQGGRGYLPQNALAYNSFVFFRYVNYFIN